MTWLNNTWLFASIIRPSLDISILAFLIYKIYTALVKSRSIQAFKGSLGLLLLYIFAYLLKLDTILWIYATLGPFLLVGVAIVFQPELRKVFSQAGRNGWFSIETASSSNRIDRVLNAAEALAKQRRGALIVIARSFGLKSVIETGTRLDAEISSSLIRTIFGHDTPMHDGAIVIVGGRLVAAGCFLPLSKQEDIKRSFGTRHRAALGLSEESDAIILIVSEETGAISLAYDGALHYDVSVDEARHHLRQLLHMRESKEIAAT